MSSEREPNGSVAGLVLEDPAERSLPLFDELKREKKEGIPDVCCCEEELISVLFRGRSVGILLIVPFSEQRCFCGPPPLGRFSSILFRLGPPCQSRAILIQAVLCICVA